MGRVAGIVFGLWVLSAAVAALISAAGFYLFGEIDGIGVVSGSLFLLGIPQGIIIHRYGYRIQWFEWFTLSMIGLVVVIPLAVVVYFIAAAGGGLNPETDIRGCLLWGVVVLGFVFGCIQNARSSDCPIWGFIYAFIVTAAALVGGMVGFSVYSEIGTPGAYNSADPGRVPSMAVGLFVGIIVYGILTGLCVAYALTSTNAKKLTL